MSGDQKDPIAAWASYLADRNGLKVWSVIVTVLGDMAQCGPETKLRGPDLTAILTRIGLQPDAIRVALHRLRRDGWIESTRTGRVSDLRLSPRGLSETLAVTDRVFGETPPDHQLVLALTDPQAEEPASPPGIAIRRGTFLACDDAVAPGQFLTAPVAQADLPDWVSGLPAVTESKAEFDTLGCMLDTLQPDLTAATPLDRAALRALILHGWRRALLRVDPVIEPLLGPDTGITPVRRRVLACLTRLPRNFERLASPSTPQRAHGS